MAKKHRFDYFDAFVRQAEVAKKESQALLDAVEDYHPEEEGWFKAHLDEMHAIESEGDSITHEIFEHLAIEFMPPIDREDVTELASLLDDVTDKIEEVMQHLYMFNLMELHPYTIKMVRIIDDSVVALSKATEAFNEFKKPKKLDKLLVAVHDCESEGDLIYIESKHNLFVNSENESAAYLVAWNNMFSHMEACCDTCESVASVMHKIALKNS
ncbi:MAG: DUF47 family protein [Coriobacteriales bacterium]|nr:DUF47 family protein [Coriobacteriales bacterium]